MLIITIDRLGTRVGIVIDGELNLNPMINHCIRRKTILKKDRLTF